MVSLTRTEQIWIRPHKTLSRLCHLSKNLYNEGNYLIRQKLFNHEQWLRYEALYHQIKFSNNYHLLPAQTAQQILKILDRNWKSFFGAIREWEKTKSKFKSMPKPPRYKPKNGEFLLVFTNQQVKLQNKVLQFPKKVGLEVGTRLSDTTDIREVRIIPKGRGYILEIVYNKKIYPKPLNKDNALAIDFGVNNLITAVNNNGFEPFIIKGGVVKSINQYYNKERARIQATYEGQGLKLGKTMLKLSDKRARKLYDYFHKTSRRIIDFCVNHEIGTLILGYNPEWKQNCALGRRNTQNFVNIPYYKLIRLLVYKAEEQGITIIKQEESYSSRCSFLDDEPIHHHEKYAGKRISRGLFKSKEGMIINADVNGAYNILKKAVLKAFDADRIEDVGLHPTRWRLAW